MSDVSFDLHPGEVLCVVGESGSGKSTLLQTVSGQYAPQSGSVWYDTRSHGFADLAGLTTAERRLLARTDWGYVRQHARDDDGDCLQHRCLLRCRDRGAAAAARRSPRGRTSGRVSRQAIQENFYEPVALDCFARPFGKLRSARSQ